MSTVMGSNALNDCGCCQGLIEQTPVSISNRPSLTALAYRVGVHSQFMQTMLVRLAGAGHPIPRDLGARDTADFATALLDAWATVADVLTFYQERIANEAYLRTATERLSLLELARLVGYEAQPGVAASACLAFTLEDAPGAFGQALNLTATAQQTPAPAPPITIDIGTKVQSIPGPGEKAQVFETVEKIEARAEWNAIKPRLTQPQQLSVGMGSVVLQGTATNLKAGDTVSIAEKGKEPKLHKIVSVTPDYEAKTTRIDLNPSAISLESLSTLQQPQVTETRISDLLDTAKLNNDFAKKVASQWWGAGNLHSLATMMRWKIEDLAALIGRVTQPRLEPVIRPWLAAETGLFVFRKRVAVFGYNASKVITYFDTSPPVPKPQESWDEWTPAEEAGNRIFLDNAYEEILPGSYIAIHTSGGTPIIRTISSVAIHPRTAYGLSSKTTELVLSDVWWNPTSKDDFKIIRGTSVDVQSEQLTLAEAPIEDTVESDSITLDRVYLGLQVGQKMILTGECCDPEGIVASEFLTLRNVDVKAGITVLTFTQSLAHSYRRETVTLNANVALATHGESVREILGSGDAIQPFQQFTLRQPPLTHVSADTPSGSRTTLEVRVNELLWQEVPNFYGHSPDERIYVTRTDAAGNTTVLFGDGNTGARLPTGQNNVQANYRKGIGLSGLLQPNQLSQLMTRPLGVRAVTNPFAAAGAAEQESPTEIRCNAPLTALTLDRIVSLQDYEDFTNAFAGITKALATWTWIGERRGVFITVAGANGAAVTDDSLLYRNLLDAIAKVGNPGVPVVVRSYEERLFRLEAAIKVQSDYRPDLVLAAVEQTLRERFSFAARAFGQPVSQSEVIAVMQNVPGVQAVAMRALYRVADLPDKSLSSVLPAALPRPGDREIKQPAELLRLDSVPVDLEVLR
ncbi:MAG: putative baseplate assembly protein [Candidatus Competibacteraceae bacterium]